MTKQRKDTAMRKRIVNATVYGIDVGLMPDKGPS